MIRNEKQYKITRKLFGDVVGQIKRLKSDTEIDPWQKKLVLTTTESFRKDLDKEIRDYEKLKVSKSARLSERNIAELPEMIIEYKIAHHLTHKEFSKILGLKEQQLQRYESQGFKTVSFQNLIKFISLLNMDIRIKEMVIHPKRKTRTTPSKAKAKL